MKDLKKLLFSSLAKQKIASVSKWAMINKIVSDILKNDFNIDIFINWKIEHNIYIIKTQNSALSNLLFLNKKKVLEKINLRLSKMWLSKISDIKLV